MNQQIETNKLINRLKDSMIKQFKTQNLAFNI